jgi:hypothetical protein
MTTFGPRFLCTDPVRICLCTVALTIAPATASAYIDPGTGSLLFQSLLAMLFGIGVAFRKLREWFARAWRFVLRRPRAEEADRRQ